MEIRSRVRGFILESFLHGTAPEQLCDDAPLLESQILDSTGVLELVVFLEQEFGIQVADEDLVPENLNSVDSVCAYLTAKGIARDAA